jgi:phosphoglycolate phosphatase
MKRFPFDVVAFDLDGTLLDTAPDLTAAVNHMLAQSGRNELTQDEVIKMSGGGMRLLMERTLAATGPVSPALVADASRIFLTYYEAHLTDKTRPYAGAGEALALLRSHEAKLTICTNKPERLTRNLLSFFGWANLFAAVVGGDTLATRKPDPTGLLEAIRLTGGGRGVLVGDSITDVETAKAAKVPSLIMTFGYHDRSVELLGATRLLAGYDQLLPALLDLGSSLTTE